MAAKKSTNSTKPAKSDTFVDLVNEEHRMADLGVLPNDHGPATLYSLLQNPPATIPGTPLPVSDDVQLPSGAIISMNADGTVHYDSSTWTSAFLSRLQGMHAGQRIVDSFTYTIRTEDGAFSTARVTLLIEGKNDAATITGTSTGELTEDASLSATGTLMVNDVDAGDKKFQTPASLDGTYGTFSFDAASGVWGYALSNGAANVQALNAGQTVVDSLTVTSKDGSASQTISVNIHGADEIVIDPDPAVNAVIGGTASGAVSEDGTLTVNAALSITDPNAGEAGFQAPASLHGTYGDFTFAPATGIWGYALRNGDANVQVLAQGEHHADTLVVHSLDGTATQTISVIVNGASEAPTLAALEAITFTDTSADDAPAPVNGTALGHDVNAGTTLHYTASATPTVLTAFNSPYHEPPSPSAWGELSIDDVTGAYTYTADAANLNMLVAGEHVTLSYTITVDNGLTDAVSQPLTITLNGANDPAAISGSDTGTVTEDDILSASGALVLSERDFDEDFFDSESMWINGAFSELSFTDTAHRTVGTVDGLYGTFTFDIGNGDWDYALDNDAAQALGAELHPTETLRAVSQDGRAVHTIVVTVNGADEAPTLAAMGAITIADTSVDDAPQPVGGTALGHDGNVGTTLHYTASATPGVVTSFIFPFNTPPEPLSWGELSIDGANGAYIFTADAASIDMLRVSEHVTLSYTLAVTNGIGGEASQPLTITLTGASDTAVFSGSDTGSVTEDDTLSTSGTLDCSHLDHDSQKFDGGATSINGVVSTFIFSDPANLNIGTINGSYGKFTFNDFSGEWLYELNNVTAQALGADDHPTESLLIYAAGDAAAHTIVVTVNGADEPAAAVDPIPVFGPVDNPIIGGHKIHVIGTTTVMQAA